jgi:uncharacterized protein (TIGR03437 family)
MAVSSNQSATITASYNGSSANATVNLVAPVLISSLTCNPTSLGSNASSTCTVTLSQAAPAGGSAVTLSDNSTVLTVPASVTVAAAATSATFSVTTTAVSSNQSATITASYNGSSANATVNLVASVLISSLTCNPTSLGSNASSTCTVTLSQAAPAGGSTVTLSDNSTALTVPASVAVAANSGTANFTASTGPVTNSQTVVVTASLNGSSATVSMTLQPASTLAAAYGFNEGSGSITADDSGNGNTGQLYKQPAWTTGKHGTALSFNGNSFVDIGNGPSLRGTGSMTWSAWVYATANPSDDGNIVAKSAWGQGLIGYQFKTTPDTGPNTFGILISADGSTYTERCSKTVRALNTWYYVAAVYNASARTLDIYVNGVLDNGVLYGTIPGVQYNPVLNATLGKRSDGFNFKGTIDDVRIYNRALSQVEIQSDMNTAVTISNPGTPAAVTKTTSAAVTKPYTQVPGAVAGALAPVSSLAHNLVSGLFCSPRVIDAGGQASCELRVSANSPSSEIRITSSSEQVKGPAAVATRANQTRLTFQVSADVAARQQFVTVAATLGGASVQDTIQVAAASHPVVTVPDRQFVRQGSSIRFMVTAIDPADLPVKLTASEVPPGAVFDAATGRFEWTPGAGQNGKYQITFAATNSASQYSSKQVPIEVGPGLPDLAAVQRGCSPDSIASLAGSWFIEAGSDYTDRSGGAMELGGVRVRLNGQYAPVLSVSSTRIDFLCPALNPGAQLEVSVETGSGVTRALNIAMQSASPWIFPLSTSGQSQGTISFAGTTELAMPRSSRMPAHPAQAGDEVLVWGTGFGSSNVSSDAVSVILGGVEARSESVSAVPGLAGVYVVKVRVPMGTAIGDAVPLQVQVMGSDGRILTCNTVSVAVEDVSR